MKKLLLMWVAGLFLASFATPNRANAQCANDNVAWLTSSAATWTAGTWNTLTTCQYAGEYYTVTGLVPGSSYSFQTCGGAGYDTQITVYNTTGGAALAYNDDGCGLQSIVTITAPASGSVRVLIDQYFCTSNTTCTTLQGRCNSGCGAAGPANDAPCGAVALTLNAAAVTGTNTGATFNAGEPGGCMGGPTVWYSFTIPAGCPYNVQVDLANAATNYDTYLGVYSAASCAGPFTQIGCNDDAVGLSSQVNLTGLAAGTYYVQVGGFASSTGNFGIDVSGAPSGPANDAICNNTLLTLNAGCTAGTNTCATSDAATPSCVFSGANLNVWYRFVIPAGCNQNVSINTDNAGINFDTGLSVYSSSDNTCTGVLTEIGCNDDNGIYAFGFLASTVNINNLAPGTYFVLVNGYNGQSGNFCVNVTATPVGPANDAVCSATALAVPSAAAYSNACSGVEAGEPSPGLLSCASYTDWCGAAASNSVWFTIVGPASGAVEITATGFDTQLALWSAASCAAVTGGGATLLSANDDDPQGLLGVGSRVAACVTPGQTYYLQLDGFNAATGNATITVSAPTSVAWNGSVSNAWTTTTNWFPLCNPTCANPAVIIPAGAPNNLVITGSRAANGMTLTGTANVTMGAGAVLDLCGNFNNSAAGATFNGANGTVNFIGTALQQFTSTGTTTFQNVGINNASNVNLNSNMVLNANGILNFTAGSIITNANGVVLNRTTAPSVTGFAAGRFIRGRMFQAVATGQTFDLPVGTVGTNLQPATINFTSAAGFNYVSAEMIDGVPGAPALLQEPVNNANYDCFIYPGTWRVEARDAALGLICAGYTTSYNFTAMPTTTSCAGGYFTLMSREANGTCTSSSWALLGPATQSTNASSISRVFTSFSDKAPAGGSLPLPVELLSLAAVPSGNYIDVRWSTETETNNSGFWVERATDGQTFTQLGFKPGAVNSTTQHNYNYADNNVVMGQRYFYRLRQVDLDGTEKLSSVVEATLTALSSSLQYTMYPNPTNGSLNISFNAMTAQTITLRFMDATGREVLERTVNVEAGPGSVTVDMGTLVAGSYQLQVSDGQGVQIHRVVKM